MILFLISFQKETKQVGWLLPILEDALRHLFERLLVEQVKELLTLLNQVQYYYSLNLKYEKEM